MVFWSNTKYRKTLGIPDTLTIKEHKGTLKNHLESRQIADKILPFSCRQKQIADKSDFAMQTKK